MVIVSSKEDTKSQSSSDTVKLNFLVCAHIFKYQTAVENKLRNQIFHLTIESPFTTYLL